MTEPTSDSFKPVALYQPVLDRVAYLREDVGYIVCPVDRYLALLVHPHEDREVGVLLYSFRFLYERSTTICLAAGLDMLDYDYWPWYRLRIALETAYAMSLGDGTGMSLGNRYDAARAMLERVYLPADEIRKIHHTKL